MDVNPCYPSITIKYPSSRSQCIINICCIPKKIDGEFDDELKSASLTIVDLAGAEREKKTRNQVIKTII